MNDLFPLDLPAASLQSPRLRVVPVVGDGMAPTMRPRQDFALCLPVSSYDGEGVYLLANCLGGQDFWRAEASVAKGRGVRLFRDNPAYPGAVVSEAEFEEAVLCKVVADIKVRDGQALRRATDSSR